MKFSGYWCSSDLCLGHSPGSGAHFSELVFQGIEAEVLLECHGYDTGLTEVAEELAANLITLINMFGFNTVATAFI